MFLKSKIIIIFLFIISCQPIELIQPVKIENTNLEKISINAKEISINIIYNPIFSEENIEDQLQNSPLELIKNWNNENIDHFGNENKLIINIIDASIFKKEIDNINAKKYEEKTIFQYEIFYLVEYELYDDSDFLIANTLVESKRSTTSQKYISINESELIINELLLNALKDFTKETKLLLSMYIVKIIQGTN